MINQVSGASASQTSIKEFSDEAKRPSPPSFARKASSSGLEINSSKAISKDQMPGGTQRENHASLLSLQVYAHGQMANSAVGMALPISYNYRGKEHDVFFKNEDNKLSFYSPSLQRPFSSPNILSLRMQRDPHFGHGLTIDNPFVGQLAQQAMQSLEVNFGPRSDPNFQQQLPHSPAPALAAVNNMGMPMAPNGHALLGPRLALPSDPASWL